VLYVGYLALRRTLLEEKREPLCAAESDELLDAAPSMPAPVSGRSQPA
jgi:hypothetical protein